jgi:DNA-directed RNA polymerase specialized sigma subunit
MANEFFEVNSPEEEEEVYQKYLKLTPEEVRRVSSRKSRLYLSVEDMDLIQDGFQTLIEVVESVGGDVANKRRVMQMGYALEDIKQKLKRRIEREDKRNGGCN